MNEKTREGFQLAKQAKNLSELIKVTMKYNISSSDIQEILPKELSDNFFTIRTYGGDENAVLLLNILRDGVDNENLGKKTWTPEETMVNLFGLPPKKAKDHVENVDKINQEKAKRWGKQIGKTVREVTVENPAFMGHCL